MDKEKLITILIVQKGYGMDNRPIGVFDSGVGGLTTVRELHKILPNENIVYFGDTGRVPYGTRSRQTIKKYAIQDIKYLKTFDVKAVVIACGTVSSNVTKADIDEVGLDIPYTGVVLPAVKEACKASAIGRIGVIATPATIKSGAYESALCGINPKAKLFSVAAPLLVPLVENGMTDISNQITRLALEMYLDIFMKEKVDTLILGCTHYPLLRDIAADILGSSIKLIDSGACAAKEIKEMMAEKNIFANAEKGKTIYRVTDSVENFASVAANFLFENIEACTEYVDTDIISAL